MKTLFEGSLDINCDANFNPKEVPIYTMDLVYFVYAKDRLAEERLKKRLSSVVRAFAEIEQYVRDNERWTSLLKALWNKAVVSVMKGDAKTVNRITELLHKAKEVLEKKMPRNFERIDVDETRREKNEIAEKFIELVSKAGTEY